MENPHIANVSQTSGTTVTVSLSNTREFQLGVVEYSIRYSFDRQLLESYQTRYVAPKFRCDQLLITHQLEQSLKNVFLPSSESRDQSFGNRASSSLERRTVMTHESPFSSRRVTSNFMEQSAGLTKSDERSNSFLSDTLTHLNHPGAIVNIFPNNVSTA